MKKSFENRFEISEIENGSMIIAGLLEDGINKESSIEIHEAIMERIYQIGLAYKLKYCSLIDIFGDLKLNDLTCPALIAELEFVDELVNDPLLKKTIPQLVALANECVKQKGKVKFIISGN
jgi:hypothetical protein